MMEFEEMSAEDIAGVVRLFNELVYFIKNETKDEYFDFNTLSDTEVEMKLRDLAGKQGFITFVAKEAGNVIAFISGEVRECFLPISKVKKVGYISSAYVLPGYRNQHVLKNLEGLMLEYFRSQGLSYAELNVMTKNITGKRAWESLGYKTFREQMRKGI
ncbi:MAG TPA: GNAT family N-acetyltransferase [Clostridiales bacterium]|nr:GNAT family N-acetyltransferase [Clostridiales bacterium]